MNKISKSAFSDARNAEFKAFYEEVLSLLLRKGNTTDVRRAAMTYAIQNGRPRYHVSLSSAYPLVCKALKNGNLPITSANRLGFIAELTERVRPLTELGVSVWEALAFVIDHCYASRYWIESATAYTHICSHRESVRS